jgi:uncharacterized repeat protein (TIGR03803 family)
MLLAATGLAALVAGIGSATAWTIHVLHDFCAKGSCARSFSNAGLTIDAAGNLYGTRETDGKYKKGSVFRLSFNAGTRTWDFTVLHDFCAQQGCSDGSEPFSAPIVDVAGNIYGTTNVGGATNEGVLYEITASGKYKMLANFCPGGDSCPDGSQPFGLTYAGAVLGQPYDGTSPLYGSAFGQTSGVVFEIDHANGKWTIAGVYTFPTPFGGRCYADAVTLGNSGNLYGATELCGDEDKGEAFVLAPSEQGWSQITHYSFDSAFEPRGQVLMDSRGDLYGVTEYGGKFGAGIAYELKPLVDTYRIKTLHQFSRSGAGPMAGLTSDSAGNFYGTTDFGGPGMGGVVFELTGKTYQQLYDFCRHGNCSTGSTPIAAVTMDNAGNLYGVTTQGGAYGNGTVFELTP